MYQSWFYRPIRSRDATAMYLSYADCVTITFTKADICSKQAQSYLGSSLPQYLTQYRLKSSPNQIHCHTTDKRRTLTHSYTQWHPTFLTHYTKILCVRNYPSMTFTHHITDLTNRCSKSSNPSLPSRPLSLASIKKLLLTCKQKNHCVLEYGSQAWASAISLHTTQVSARTETHPKRDKKNTRQPHLL